MNFDNENRVIIGTLTKEQALAFIKFLESEILRHQRDIEDAHKLIIQVRETKL